MYTSNGRMVTCWISRLPLSGGGGGGDGSGSAGDGGGSMWLSFVGRLC